MVDLPLRLRSVDQYDFRVLNADDLDTRNIADCGTVGCVDAHAADFDGR